MSFLHHISLPQPDPLGGGLREEIEYEQTDEESRGFSDDLDGERLTQDWVEIMEDLHRDPEWYDDRSVDE